MRYGQNHSFENCPQKEDPICFKCRERHSSAYKGCAHYKEAKAIQTIKITNKLKYAQATKQYKQIIQNTNPMSINQNRNALPKRNNPETHKRPEPHNRPETHTRTDPQKNPNSQNSFPQPRFYPTKIPVPTNRGQQIQKPNQIMVNTTDFLSFIIFIINNLEKENTHSNRRQLLSMLGVQITLPKGMR